MNEPRNIGQAIGKILVMEEEDFLRKLVESMLTQNGFQVVCAKDGAEAIRLYQSAQALQQPFDAVILDLTVTFGMGANETIKQLIEIDPKVKGIVSSGYALDDVIVYPSKYGFCGSITKPFTMSELVSTVNETIENW
jgi:DNA-binding NtrC family response regulator